MLRFKFVMYVLCTLLGVEDLFDFGWEFDCAMGHFDSYWKIEDEHTEEGWGDLLPKFRVLHVPLAHFRRQTLKEVRPATLPMIVAGPLLALSGKKPRRTTAIVMSPILPDATWNNRRSSMPPGRIVRPLHDKPAMTSGEWEIKPLGEMLN